MALLQLLLPLQLAARLGHLCLPPGLLLSSQALPQRRLCLHCPGCLLGSQLLLPGGAHILHQPAAGRVARRLLRLTLCLLRLHGGRQLGIPSRGVGLLPLHLRHNLLTVGHSSGPPSLTCGPLVGLSRGCSLQPLLHNGLVCRPLLGRPARQLRLALPAAKVVIARRGRAGDVWRETEAGDLLTS